MNKNLKISDPEEIVRKGLLQMRAAADDIAVPEELSRMIERTVDMELGHRRGRMRLIASLSSVAAAAAVAAVALVVPARPSQPQDTFDTPEEAYAAVMEVFGQIGQNIGKSMSYAGRSIEDVRKSAGDNLKSVFQEAGLENDDDNMDKIKK